MNGSDPRTCEHRNGNLRNHRQVDRDTISLFDAQRFQRVRTLTHALVEFTVADVSRNRRIVTLPDNRGFVAARV